MSLLHNLAPNEASRIIAAVDMNPSASMPYHGTPHLYVVALGAHELALMENLPEDEVRNVVLAALFHDFNHQYSTDDSVNIKCAVEAVREHLSAFDVERIECLVSSTRFPYVAVPQDISEGIMRDADIIYSTLLVPDAQRFRNGLYEERGVPASEQDTIGFIIGHGVQTESAARKLDDFFGHRKV